MIFFRIIFLPVLFPLSCIYGWVAFVRRCLTKKEVLTEDPVISVGNFFFGGTGKTPVVLCLLEILKKKHQTPIVISKSYKGTLKAPREVMGSHEAQVVGDEPLLIKKTFDQIRVFSGPNKFETLKCAEEKTKSCSNRIFVIDDGAQHYKIKKNLSICVWDLSRSVWSLFPFPLGFSREWWFLGEKQDLHLFNRKNLNTTSSLRMQIMNFLFQGVEIQFNLKTIQNSHTGAELKSDFVFISGVGSFTSLKKVVEKWASLKGLKVLKAFRGRDHDHFLWFKPDPALIYVCTEKDKIKLEKKVHPQKLFVLKSNFNDMFYKSIEEKLEVLF